MDLAGKSSSSSTFSSLSQVFPMSWFSKIKQMGKKNKSPPAKTKRKIKPFSPLSNKTTNDIVGEDDCDGDGYWQLSFTGRSASKSNKSVVSSGLYDSHDDLELPVSNCPSCRSCNREIVRKDDVGKFNDMVCNVRKKRDLGYGDREDSKVQTPRRRIQKGCKSIKVDRRILEEMVFDSGRELTGVSQRSSGDSVERNNLDLEVMDTSHKNQNGYHSSHEAFSSKTFECLSSPNSNHLKQRRRNKRVNQSDRSLENLEIVLEKEAESEKKTAKIEKNQELLSKSEKQRRSVCNRDSHKKRAKQIYKVKVHSPRTPSKVEICKIRALEDMKKAKTRKKESITKKGKALENFAVMKCSFDPLNDFRDSMVEMIVEKGLWSPEELENLLACYLSLNSIEYHDLIVRVFRQIWLEINHLRLQFGLQINGWLGVSHDCE